MNRDYVDTLFVRAGRTVPEIADLRTTAFGLTALLPGEDFEALSRAFQEDPRVGPDTFVTLQRIEVSDLKLYVGRWVHYTAILRRSPLGVAVEITGLRAEAFPQGALRTLFLPSPELAAKVEQDARQRQM